jgi:hypothetical protein
MSDYLWDKTGEPDEEVERLEALLAPLAHKARALALPAQVAPAPSRWSRLFAPAVLAAAAALLVAALAGAAALLRSRASGEVEGTAASRTRQSREEVGPVTPPAAPESAHGAHDGGRVKDEKSAAVVEHAPVRGGGAKDEGGAVEGFGRGTGAVKGARLASAQRRRQRPAPPARVGGEGVGVPVLEAMSAGGGAPSFFESTRLMTKEQLVYALRLTGSKLRDVRQKTRGDEGELRRRGFRREATEQP